jgi:hypothetical protein
MAGRWAALGLGGIVLAVAACSSGVSQSVRSDPTGEVGGGITNQQVVVENKTGWPIRVGQCTNDLLSQHLGYAGNCEQGVVVPHAGSATFEGRTDAVGEGEPPAPTRAHVRIYRGKPWPPWNVDLEVSESGIRGPSASVKAPNVWMTRTVDTLEPWLLSVRDEMSVTTRRVAADDVAKWTMTIAPPLPSSKRPVRSGLPMSG